MDWKSEYQVFREFLASLQGSAYEEVENCKCFQNCAPHEGREYLTTISDSLSCAVVISLVNPSIKIIVTIPLTTVHKKKVFEDKLRRKPSRKRPSNVFLRLKKS